jgi:hypothetical protein
MANRTSDDDMDYTAEGKQPPHEKDDPTADGYDEAARSGPGVYGVKEGEGGVFGTTGGGSFPGGMHIEERPVVDEGGDESRGPSGGRGVTKRPKE